MGTVMQRISHERARFFISPRGVLMERQGNRPSRRTDFSMERNRASRSEMQLLADLLNTPEATRLFDTGWSPAEAWAEAIDLREQDMMHGIVSVGGATGEWQRFVIAEVAHGA